MEAHTGTDVDIRILSQLIQYNKSKHLIWDGYDAKGKKKQRWVEGAVDLELHVKGSCYIQD